MYKKFSLIIPSVLFLMLVFSGCVTYYPPMFGAIDDIYVDPPEEMIDGDETFGFDGTFELDYAQNGSFYTSELLSILSLQAAGTGTFGFPISDDTLFSLAVTAGAAGGIAEDMDDPVLFDEGFLYSVGVFSQLDLMILNRFGSTLVVPGISYTASGEIFGSYFDYRRANSELDLGSLDRFCSQLLVYCDISSADKERYSPVFIRPFIGFSNIASLNPFGAPQAVVDYINETENALEAYGAFFMLYPDFGLYLGMRGENSFYFKLRASDFTTLSVSVGAGV